MIKPFNVNISQTDSSLHTLPIGKIKVPYQSVLLCFCMSLAFPQIALRNSKFEYTERPPKRPTGALWSSSLSLDGFSHNVISMQCIVQAGNAPAVSPSETLAAFLQPQSGSRFLSQEWIAESEACGSLMPGKGWLKQLTGKPGLHLAIQFHNSQSCVIHRKEYAQHGALLCPSMKHDAWHGLGGKQLAGKAGAALHFFVWSCWRRASPRPTKHQTTLDRNMEQTQTHTGVFLRNCQASSPSELSTIL